MERKLAAIFAADVVGYSRLMGEDEAGTLKRLQALLSELVKPLIKAHRGRIVKLMGDGLLAEFPSVVEAVETAVEIQRSMVERENCPPDETSIRLRIGIHLGDIIKKGTDIFGDGVNVAARLESIAPAGGVCISEDVHRQIEGKMTTHFQDLGEQELKNIKGKVRAFSVSLDPAQISPKGFEALTGERLDLPSQPSIAVLPFENMSGETDQEYFADGITEDIITALSRLPGMIVMARNSTFVYKSQAVDVRQVGYDLGVRYVLEGSIRKAGNRVRITSQLIDTQTGSHVWAERYDRDLDDIFTIQDDITREIVVAMAVNLTHGEEIKLWSTHAPSVEGWDLFMRALAEQYKFTREGNFEAEQLFRRAIALDPHYWMFKVGLGWCLQSGVRLGFKDDPAATSAEARSICEELLSDDDTNADALALKAYVDTAQRDFDPALAAGKRAVELQPGVSLNHAALGIAHRYMGNFEACLNCMRKAMRLSPYCPDWYLAFLGDAYFGLNELDQARLVYENLASRLPSSLLSQTRLAAVYVRLNNTAKASNAAAAVLSIAPQFSVSNHLAQYPFSREELRENLAQDLIKSGLPA